VFLLRDSGNYISLTVSFNLVEIYPRAFGPSLTYLDIRSIQLPATIICEEYRYAIHSQLKQSIGSRANIMDSGNQTLVEALRVELYIQLRAGLGRPPELLNRCPLDAHEGQHERSRIRLLCHPLRDSRGNVCGCRGQLLKSREIDRKGQSKTSFDSRTVHLIQMPTISNTGKESGEEYCTCIIVMPTLFLLHHIIPLWISSSTQTPSKYPRIKRIQGGAMTG
jgi:hypothetical protein